MCQAPLTGLAHLNGGAQGHADGKVHLVLHRNKHGCDVLAGVARYRQHDQAQELLADAARLRHILQRARQEPACSGCPRAAATACAGRPLLATSYDWQHDGPDADATSSNLHIENLPNGMLSDAYKLYVLSSQISACTDAIKTILIDDRHRLLLLDEGLRRLKIWLTWLFISAAGLA